MNDSQGDEAKDEELSVLRAPRDVEESLVDALNARRVGVMKASVIERCESLAVGLEEARCEAERRVEEAKSEAGAIRERARREGREAGHAEVVELVASARREYRAAREEAEADMLALAFEIARRIIGRSIELEPEIVEDVVTEALERVRDAPNVVVFVHPDDLSGLRSRGEEFWRSIDASRVDFEADESLERGGCLVETGSQRIDARLSLRLERLRDALTEAR